VAGAGGDKKKDARAAEAAGPLPIVLKVDLHCLGCARKICKAIKRAPGMRGVSGDGHCGGQGDRDTGLADVVELKKRIETTTKRLVQMVAAGTGSPKKEKAEEEKAGADLQSMPSMPWHRLRMARSIN
ncbi:hypothetical protein EJB05_49396, partial [Eragrostis curvula]